MTIGNLDIEVLTQGNGLQLRILGRPYGLETLASTADLPSLRGNAGRLEWLAKMVDQDVQDLVEVLKNATPATAVMVPADRQASEGPPVEKDFTV